MRVKYLDVLKFFAIIAVVLYHTGLMNYGYLGVDLFLVISGYLTTKSLYKSLIVNKTTGGGYFKFEISRIARLLPPLLVAGIACMIMGYLVMLPDDYENLGQSVIATNFFANNILAAITTKDYWDVVNEYKPLMHTWYVGVVMQFYIVYPFLFYLARLDKNKTKRTLLTMIATLGLISLLVYLGITDSANRFYYLPSRFFEFAVGGICALLYDSEEHKPFSRGYVYCCYVFLLALMVINLDIIPPIVRLVAIVCLSTVLLCSKDVLENKFTGNNILAKIGAASYSIFVWHQVVLAFCRYTWTSTFTIKQYVVLLLGTAVLAWLTYRFVEQATTKLLQTKRGSIILFSSVVISFIILTAFSGYIYMKAGVVRDVPELYISKADIHRGMHKEYNNKIYQLDKPFKTDKKHWLVVGNSFGRDFANVILESDVKDCVEVSYIYLDDITKFEYRERFSSSDIIFLSSLGTNESTVNKVEAVCAANGFPLENLVIVGTKNFGESNGQFYINRNKPDYFIQRTEMEEGYLQTNMHLKDLYASRYLDLIGLVIDENSTMPVFSPEHKFISQDCRHFSKGGAEYFSKLIDWNKYLK